MDTAIPKISFVGRSNFNNGITQKVNEIKGLTPYDSGCLTLALGVHIWAHVLFRKNLFIRVRMLQF